MPRGTASLSSLTGATPRVLAGLFAALLIVGADVLFSEFGVFRSALTVVLIL